MRFVQDVYPLNVMTRMGFSVLTQEYTADVNIMPKRRFLDPAALISTQSRGDGQARRRRPGRDVAPGGTYPQLDPDRAHDRRSPRAARVPRAAAGGPGRRGLTSAAADRRPGPAPAPDRPP